MNDSILEAKQAVCGLIGFQIKVPKIISSAHYQSRFFKKFRILLLSSVVRWIWISYITREQIEPNCLKLHTTLQNYMYAAHPIYIWAKLSTLVASDINWFTCPSTDNGRLIILVFAFEWRKPCRRCSMLPTCSNALISKHEK